MKRLARSTGEQRQNCFPTDLVLSGKSMHQSCDKTSFHGLGRYQDIACWHTCVSNSHLRVYGKMLQKSPCVPRRAQPTLSMTCVKSKYGSDVKSRDEKEWNARGRKKRGETKHEKLQTFQISAVGLVCMCIFSLSLSQQDGRRGGGGDKKKCLSQWKIATILYYSRCNHFNPSPVCVPGCVDTAKRCDASHCMTN